MPAAGPHLRLLMAALRVSNVGNGWAWCRLPWANRLPHGFLWAWAIGCAAEVCACVLQSEDGYHSYECGVLRMGIMMCTMWA